MAFSPRQAGFGPRCFSSFSRGEGCAKGGIEGAVDLKSQADMTPNPDHEAAAPVPVASHRRAESKLMGHVERLLDNPKLRIDTAEGTRPASNYRRSISMSDRAAEVRKIVSQFAREDSTGLGSLPQGAVMDVAFSRAKMVVFSSVVARLRVVCVSPIKQLVRGEAVKPMTVAEVNRILEENKPDSGPLTLILLSTGGFSVESHDLAERVASRTLILIEPNSAGGYSIWGPAETKALNDLLDPEGEAEKRTRVRDRVKQLDQALATTGIGADAVVQSTMLPLAIVEDELKALARTNKGLTAKRLDGRIVLYREGANPTGTTTGNANPLAARIKSVFSGKATAEKKHAFFAERKAAIVAQRDGVDDEMQLLEKKDGYLRDQFREATSDPARRRAVAQLFFVRKQLERRQGLIRVLNAQIDALDDYVATLDRLQRGESLVDVDAEQVAIDATRFEEAVAKMRGEIELSEATPPGAGTTLSTDEQRLYDDLAG